MNCSVARVQVERFELDLLGVTACPLNCPKGAKQDSPGQRPGEMVFCTGSCPERAQQYLGPAVVSPFQGWVSSSLKWVRERAIPLPPRCRTRVNSLDLPAGPFRAPGDSIAIAPGGERFCCLRRSGPHVAQ